MRRFQNDRTGYQVLMGASHRQGLLALNHRRAPLNDLMCRVRRAITHAIDRGGVHPQRVDGRGAGHRQPFSARPDAGYLHLASLPLTTRMRRLSCSRAPKGHAACACRWRCRAPTPHGRPVIALGPARVGIMG